MTRGRIVLAAIWAGVGLAGTLAARTTPAANTPAVNEAPGERHALHNVIPVMDNLTSGSVPDSDAAFDELTAMGVRTIMSVDGATPDVETARARGMRYVHIPVGYHGIEADQRLLLARAVKEVDGPIYLHCHHGKHRGPAAAAAAAVVLGAMTADEGVAFLKRAGTAPSYPGLYSCVANSSEADEATLNAIPADFPEIAPTPGFVKAMAEAQERYDHLAEIRDAGWRVPAEHPDLVPLAEAARLENLMRALIDDPRVTEEPPDFGQMMRDSAKAAQEFEDAPAARASAADLTARLKGVNDSCKSCHVKYRDIR